MRRGNALAGPVILGIALAVIFALLPPGVALAGLCILIVFSSIAKETPRFPAINRHWLLAIYYGLLSGVIIAFIRATRPE